ncbi:hypothetical protein LCI18_008170 [Fusarium solani-melongenae]|uniref:Uncharacterized protein n=1 Tax=Fusarium solani subsp. cucurbitae TaxID=2747967 RepID=A0ACD3Z7M4_FUSSC|nr:hypothetical protein LCI18_008170 [Fusarium solani-melongenae]
MALSYDSNNPYDPENAYHRLMPQASATDVGVEPELHLDTNHLNLQRDVIKIANMVENHGECSLARCSVASCWDSKLMAMLDAPINCSYQPPLSASGFSTSQSFSSFPSTSRTHEHLECGSESRRPQSLRKGGVSNNRKGCIRVAGHRWPGRNNASRRNRTPQPLQTYACPLYLQNREKHKRCKSCVLTSWGRVLQHLKRAHLAKEDHCPTCRGSFSSETLKNEHIRLGNCQTVDIAHSGVFLEEDYNKLKHIRRNSDEEKWTEAWRRLFPDLPAPSPFCESDAEMITRTGQPACIKALEKAQQGHDDLPALANELLDELRHALVPTTRWDDINTPAAEVSQATDPAHNRIAYSPSILGQMKQVTRRTAQFRDLPEASPLMVPPQVPPDMPLPSQEQIFAQPQQMPPDLSGVEQFSPETLQGWLPMQHSHSMTSQLPQHMLNDISLSQPSFATPTNLHSNAYNDINFFLSDEVMISGEWAFGRDEAEAN